MLGTFLYTKMSSATMFHILTINEYQQHWAAEFTTVDIGLTNICEQMRTEFWASFTVLTKGQIL